MKISDRTHTATSKIVQEIVKERSGSVPRKSLREWYAFVADAMNRDLLVAAAKKVVDITPPSESLQGALDELEKVLKSEEDTREGT